MRSTPDFNRLWIGQTASEFGTQMSAFVYPLIAYALSGSTFVAALGEVGFLLGLVATLIPAGVVADRYDRLVVMRTASAVGFLLFAALVVAAVCGVLTVPQMLAAAVLAGAGTGFFGPAEGSAIRTIVAAEDLPDAMSRNAAREHAASLAAAPVGGALYAVLRWLPFAVDALSYAISWVMLGRIKSDLSPTAERTPSTSMRKDVVDGWRFIGARPLFRVLVVWSALANLTINAVFSLAVLRLVQTHTPAWQIALVETAAGSFGLLGATCAPWIIRRVPTGWLVLLSSWSFVPLVVPMAFWHGPVIVALGLSAGLFVNPAGTAAIASYRVALTPAELIGRVTAALQVTGMSTLPMAPILAAAVLSLFGPTTSELVLGGAIAAVSLLPTLTRAVRTVPRAGVWQSAVRAGELGPSATPMAGEA